MRAVLLVLLAVAVSVVGPAATVPSAAAAGPRVDVPRPVLVADFPDPAVVETPRGVVAYATGDDVPHAWAPSHRGTWERAGAVLARRPAWSVAGSIWAVDVAHAGGRWVLYFAAPVRGIVEKGRCIGVAVADSARGPFRPVGREPLVCPSYAATPPAQDRLLPRDPTLPRAGVIDPSFHRDGSGAYLLYKTDRLPSSIRLLPLRDDGLRVRAGAVSSELLRSSGVVENPVLARRLEGYVMLVSVGDYRRCSYRTEWFRSTDLLDWSAAVRGDLLSPADTGLCGPGGADLLGPTAARSRVYLHGWTCRGRPLPCRGSGTWDDRRGVRAVRSMYVARLRWRGGVPVLLDWQRRPA